MSENTVTCQRCGKLMDATMEVLTWYQGEPGPVCSVCAGRYAADDITTDEIVRMMLELTRLRAELEEAKNERDRLQRMVNSGDKALSTALRERDEARAWVADLQSGMYVNCVYCGYRYGRKEEVPESMADVLKAHVEKCPKHPMSLLKREYAKAKEALPILQELLDTHNEANPWLGVCAAATLRTNELTSLRSENTRLKAEMRGMVRVLDLIAEHDTTSPDCGKGCVEEMVKIARASRKERDPYA